ncbi:hypothetical protein Hanom_Chr11g00992531 [Helianthus anomalus]
MSKTGFHSVVKLDMFDGGSKTYIPKNFYRTGGSKPYIPKHFYTKTTYITLLSEKFGGSGAPPSHFKASPMLSLAMFAPTLYYINTSKLISFTLI